MRSSNEWEEVGEGKSIEKENEFYQNRIIIDSLGQVIFVLRSQVSFELSGWISWSVVK